jgi:hypothetical protein
MTVHMKPGQWDFFWDWHLESPDLTLADMLRMIREQEEAKEAETAAEEAEETEAWILQQEGTVLTGMAEEEAEAEATADPRVAVADRLEAAAKEAEAMVADLEDRACEMRSAARAYREMSERLRLQMAAPAPDPPAQTWMERFKEQKKWGDMWYDQASGGYVSITPVTSHRD